MKFLVVTILLALGLGACAASKKDAKLPSEMQRRHGMTESRAKGMGEGSLFSK